MAKMFTDAELKGIISRLINLDGYFVTCYAKPKQIYQKVFISATGLDGWNCVIIGYSTREEALKQLMRAGLNPEDFTLKHLYFYRAMLD
jgi:hypothetical protein